MKVQEKDLFHGGALTQIVEHHSFKALNKASKSYGHYMVNTDRQVFVKYRTAKRSPWQFVFTQDELRALRKAIGSGDSVFACLVCGTSTVCALTAGQIETVIDVQHTSGTQWIKVDVPKGGSCWVSGSQGKLNRSVPHNSFPNRIFS